MRTTLSILVYLLAFVCVARAQAPAYEPRILILSPAKVAVDKAFQKEIDSVNGQITQSGGKAGLTDPKESREPANLLLMASNIFGYRQHADFAKQTSLIAAGYLEYRFFEHFPDLLILLKDTTCSGKPAELKKIAEASGQQYVLNFPSLQFYGDDGLSYARLGVQLYDLSTNTLLVDSSFVGDCRNHGFEWTCHDGSLSCTIDNSLSRVLDNIFQTVAGNSPKVKRAQELFGQRFEVLKRDFYAGSFDKGFVGMIVPATDSAIRPEDQYQLLVSRDKTKFVGFYLAKKDKPTFGQLSAGQQDKNVQILTNKNIHDSDYLTSIPQTYAYIIKGVRYKDKWYYEKAGVTWFDPQDHADGRMQYFSNLQQWGFFKEGSTEIDPEFWETHLFAKVRDLRKDPDWDKYGSSIWKREEEENRHFVGLYELVADQLKNKKSGQPKTINVN